MSYLDKVKIYFQLVDRILSFHYCFVFNYAHIVNNSVKREKEIKSVI